MRVTSNKYFLIDLLSFYNARLNTYEKKCDNPKKTDEISFRAKGFVSYHVISTHPNMPRNQVAVLLQDRCSHVQNSTIACFDGFGFGNCPFSGDAFGPFNIPICQ